MSKRETWAEMQARHLAEERALFLDALADNGWSLRGAAVALGMVKHTSLQSSLMRRHPDLDAVRKKMIGS